jgi:hypothetical protein
MLEEYKTSDIGLAAYLMTKKMEFAKLEDRGNGKKIFVFKNTDELAKTVNNYVNKVEDISAIEYRSSLRACQDLLKANYSS